MQRELTVGIRLVTDTGALDELNRKLSGSLADFSGLADTVGNKSIATAGNMARSMANDFGNVTSKMVGDLSDLGQGALGVLGDMASGLEGMLDDLGGGLGDLFSSLFSGDWSSLSGLLVDGLTGDWSSMLDGLLNLGDLDLGSLLDGFLGKLGGLDGIVKDLLGPLSDTLSSLGSDTLSSLVDAGSSLFGDVGDAISSIFGGGGTTPEEAVAYIENAAGSLERVFDSVRQGNLSLGEMHNHLVPMVDRMMVLAHTAGYTKDEVSAMITAIDPELGQALLNMATPAGQAAQAVREFAANTQNFTTISSEAEDELIRWAGSVGRTEDEVRSLVSQLRNGEIGVQQFADAFSGGQSVFQPFANGVMELNDNLRGLRSNLNQVGNGINNLGGGAPGTAAWSPPAVMHDGGRVPVYAHSGLLVPRLYPEEVPIIARRGEFVVRAESVNASSLPWLQALNQGASATAPAGAMTVNGPLVEIHGNMLGGDESVEELARVVESKLRDLAAGRYGA